ncbi:LamB/YcsF family protein [Heyndrickxia acidiproducens]|uniref:LamB/YcsF family protein n=1 Tax=Heyndrickxia acidiproducens TaxID=1121084 RepID=UPI00036991FF|nr:5-oxoprolinase subunit PxpA [Heyndrickxia acidiproducens]
MTSIDLNCDMGESFGAYTIGKDADILDYITSANIACGFHAGDPAVMRKTVRMALEKNIAVGAHPGLPDLAGFGRRNMQISAQEAYEMVVYQIGALAAFAKAEGGHIQHVKPHGALYNMAAKDKQLSEAIAEAVYRIDPEMILFGLAGSELVKAGKKAGLRTASEVFSDRTYQQDGSLTSRREAGAFIDNRETAVNQVIRMIKAGKVLSVQGQDVAIQADTICIHGDGKHALEFAALIHTALENEGITIENAGCFL